MSSGVGQLLARRVAMWRIERAFRKRMGRPPRWQDPRNFSDKLQWLKIHHRDPLMVRAGAKLAARDYVRERVGEEVLTPLLGVWTDPDAIDFDALPERFALKLNAGSGKNVLCHDRSQLDVEAVREHLRAWLRIDYGSNKGEWHYALMPRCILCEPHLADGEGRLWEFKFSCFHGRVRLAYVVVDRSRAIGSMFLDESGRPVEIRRPRKRATRRLDPSEVPMGAWDQMIDVAQRIAEPFLYVRVDLYLLDGAVRFGEVTFFPSSGMTPLDPPSMDRQLGDWLELPRGAGADARGMQR